MTRFLPLAALTTLAACAPSLDAELQDNPVCALSPVVRWSTRQPASSWVELGQAGSLGWRIGDDELVEDHEVVVLGPRAGESWELQAVSVTDSGRELRSESLSFTAGELPESWFAGQVDVYDPAQVQPGWTIANITTGSITPVLAVILDMQGQPVWYYQHEADNDGSADIQVSWIEEERELLLGPHVGPGDRAIQLGLAGEVSWRGPEQPGDPDNVNIQDGQLHHVMYRLASGDIVSVQSDERELDGDRVQGDTVVQLDDDLQQVWSWSAFDHVDYDPDDVFLGLWWTHINSVHVDQAQDLVWINSWALSRAWKVQRSSGEILWALGEDGDFQPDPSVEIPWFEFAHSFDPIGDDRYLVYDNGGGSRGFSRVVEYALDEQRMQAEIAWQYPGDHSDEYWDNRAMGDVDLLDNDNRLITAERSFMEVTSEGEKVWQMWWSDQEAHEVRSYQAERIPSLLQPLD